MSWTVEQLADFCGGRALGTGELKIAGLTRLEDSCNDTLSPLLQKAALVQTSRANGAILCPADLADAAFEAGATAVLAHPVPRSALAVLLELFAPKEEKNSEKIHSTAVVDPGAVLEPGVEVGPLCVVEGGVTVGAGTRIESRAVVRAGTRIGAEAVIGPGAVIGSEGFGYLADEKGVRRLRHLGNVVIGDRVEIGANTCVDRATLGSTVIGDDSKLDNLVQIGHNCRIGRGVFIAGQVGVAGSTVIEDGVVIGGQAGIGDHLVVGAGARIAGKSGVTSNVAPGATVAGYPAWEHRLWRRAMASLLRAARKGAPNRRD